MSRRASADRSEAGDAPLTDAVTADDIAWVRNATDAAVLNRERLHAVFLKMVFGGKPPEGDDIDELASDSDSDDDGARQPTAEELADKEEMRAELAELTGAAAGGDSDEEGSLFEFDKISENEDAEREAEEAMFGQVDDDFLNWISKHDSGLEAGATERTRETAPSFLAGDLQARNLTEHDEAIKKAPLPERLRELMETDSALRDGTVITIPVANQAAWIAIALCNEGRGLCGTGFARDVANGSVRQLVVDELAFALELILNRKLEPGHIAVYHKTAFPHLMTELLGKSMHKATPDANMPYSSITGARVNAVDAVNRETGLFDGLGGRIAASPDSGLAARAAEETGLAQHHKPSYHVLGRLLWEVAELQVQCLGLERQRQIALARLVAANRTVDVQLLLQRPFESPFDASVWSQYSAFCSAVNAVRRDPSVETRSATARAIANGFGDALDAFALPPEDFQAHVAGHMTATPMPQRDCTLEAWASQQLQQAGLDVRRVVDCVDLCVSALKEQLTCLPLLRRAALAAYKAHAAIEVQHSDRLGQNASVKLVTLLDADGGRHAMQLLEAEAEGRIRLVVKIPRASLEQALRFDEYVALSLGTSGADHSGPERHWYEELRAVTAFATARIASYVEPHIKTLLRRAAERFAVAEATNAIGTICEQGPYQRTMLCLPGWQAAHSLWDASWNCAEALEERRDLLEPNYTRRAVCGVYRGDDQRTCFAFIDADGIPRGRLSWIDAAIGNPEGLKIHEEQVHSLLLYCKMYQPEVFAVGVNGIAAKRTYENLVKFVREQLVPTQQRHIPVVWESAVLAQVSAASEATQRAMPGVSDAHRIATCLAMSVRDPLVTLTRLFDVRQTALSLPIGCETFKRSGIDLSAVYRAMQWEVSLWVAAIGVDLNAIVAGPTPSLTLQFVTGLGPRRAKEFLELIERGHGGVVKSREDVSVALASLTEDSEALVRNAAPVMRVFPVKALTSEPTRHPLDATLIPPLWYDFACHIAGVALEMPWAQLTPQLRPLAAIAFMRLDRHTARTRLRIIEHYMRGLLADAGDTFTGVMDSGVTFRPDDVYFVFGELVAAGESYAARPYRRMTSTRFFQLTTNVVYAAHKRQSNEAWSPALHMGDIVEGAVDRILVRDNSVAVRVVLSHGFAATMDASDVSNTPLRQALDVYAMHYRSRERELEMRNVGVDDRRKQLSEGVSVPPQLAKGQAVFGVLLGVNYDRGEGRIRWVDTPSPDDVVAPSGGRAGSIYRSSAQSLASRDTVRTRDLERTALVAAYKTTQHPLYRSWGKDKVVERLSKAENIGECLIYKRKVDGPHFAVAMKIGEEATSLAFVGISEFRNAKGKIMYRLAGGKEDDSHEETYEDVDHVLRKVLHAVRHNVLQLRKHERFDPSHEECMRNLDEEAASKRQSVRIVEQHIPLGANGTPYVLKCKVVSTDAVRAAIPVDQLRVYEFEVVVSHKGYMTQVRRQTVRATTVRELVELWKRAFFPNYRQARTAHREAAAAAAGAATH